MWDLVGGGAAGVNRRVKIKPSLTNTKGVIGWHCGKQANSSFMSRSAASSAVFLTPSSTLV